VLVPLDGSELAERASTPAQQIAQSTRSKLLLRRVTPLVTWPIGTMHLGGGMAPSMYDEVLAAEDHAA
jgi:nucleotide-binding universal stress UspA family protein